MPIREYTYGEAQTPIHQSPLRPIKGEPGQDQWIVMACGDKTFSLKHIVFDGDAAPLHSPKSVDLPYSGLWSALAALLTEGRKAWLIGWRISYALDRAGFVDALSAGQVKLPTIKAGKNRGKHGGKLSNNGRVLEVDVVCGRNQIKLLDWQNFGVEPPDAATTPDSAALHIAEQSLRNFLALADSIGVKVNRTTAAQLGWTRFREQDQCCELSANRDPVARELERRAYVGGRNEAYYLGNYRGTVYSLDVRSCYAAICRDQLLPRKLDREYRMGLDVADIDRGNGAHWIADVVVNTTEADYPLNWQGKPIYPVGQFRTTLAWPELVHALQRLRVVKVLRAARYIVGPVFRDYAEWYLGERKRPKQPRQDAFMPALKAMFNSSLGFSARQKYEWVEWQTQIGFDYWLGVAPHPEGGDAPVSAQKLDTESRWLKIAGEPREAMPFLHATICSYARVRLLQIFEIAGRENILYCDTDGILVNYIGFDALQRRCGMIGPNPGELCERFRPGTARIQGQKSYRVGNNWIQAGAVRTRHSGLVERRVLTTDTGRTDSEGRVHPFAFRCEQTGKNGEWINEEA